MTVQRRLPRLPGSTVRKEVWLVLRPEGLGLVCFCSVCHLASPDHQIASVMSDLPGRVAL